MLDLDYKKFTLSRIAAFSKQIELLREINFPYKDSSDALDKISAHIDSQRERVENSVMGNDRLRSSCARASSQLFVFHRFLGYIAKSADPLNSFEIYFSFRRLSEFIFGKKTRLIISSEWEDYSPVNFTIPKELVDFVFIGLPVSEAENALIVPLGGHELGHSIWAGFDFKDKYRRPIQESVLTSFSKDETNFIIKISLIKCEEYTCDCIGIGLFGESYLYAFSYLIAPKISDRLITSHPNAGNRANAMNKAAQAYGYKVPSNFEDLFKTIPTPESDRYQQCLAEAEKLSFKMVDTIVDDVKQLLLSKNVLYERSADYDHFKDDLLTMVPISTAKSLADITNAAWDVYFKEDKWEKVFIENEIEEKKVVFLNELTLKSFEILEIHQRLGK